MLSSVFSQNIDSLIGLLDSSDDVEELLVEIVTYYENVSPQNTIDYADTLLLFAKESGNANNQAFALSKLGKGSFYLGNYTDAYTYWKLSLEKYTEIGSETGIAEQYNSIGAYFYSIGDYENGLKYYLFSLDIRKKLQDTSGIAYCLNNIGNVYYAKNQRDLSLETYLEALNYAKLTSDKKILSIVLNNVGAEYAFLEDYEKALDYHFQAVELKKELNNEMSLAVTYMSIGSIYKAMEDYVKARNYYDIALVIFKAKNSKYYQAKMLNQIAGLFNAQIIYDSALFYLYSSLDISLEINSLSLLEDNYWGLSTIYDSLNNSSKSLEFLQKYQAVHDTLFNEQSDKRIKDLQIKYETEKKEQENLILTNQIEIETLKSDRRRNLMYFFVIISMLLLVSALLIFNRYNVKQKLSKLLTEKNIKLLESEQNLMTEINTKDKFFSIIAHDLKSPLSSLTLVSEMLDDNLTDFSVEQLKYYINSISLTTSGLFNLVENLLNWARSQAGRVVVNLQSVNVYEIVTKLVELQSVSANKKNIEIINLVNEDTTVKADINLLTLILRNLVANALKFTDEGGKVTISTNSIDNQIFIEVKDTGIGISKEDQEKLFRIDINTKEIGNSAEKGTGLGLILCKEFTEKMNGKIWAESELGKGTKFCVELTS